MNTPNNAAALERLEQKWRDKSAQFLRKMKNQTPGNEGWYDGASEAYGTCADELATLRATLTQPDALTSQPSGEAVAFARVHDRTNPHYGDVVLPDSQEAEMWAYDLIPLYTHPSADAPGVAVDEWWPIESAPAGVPILVRYVNSAGKERVIKARFIRRFTEESSSDCDGGVDEYDEANDRYTYCEGWWEMIDNWDDFAFVAVSEGSPTHWHKIPSTAALAPKPEGGHG